MNEIKGKFITLTARLVEITGGGNQDLYDAADKQLFNETGKHVDELDPEEWYELKYYNDFMYAFIETSPEGEDALIELGKQIYPTIEKTVGFPPGLETPADYIQFEIAGYLDNCRGPQVQPREIVEKEDRRVVVRTKMTEQPCKTLEGIYLGIFELAGEKNGKVKHEKCIRKGDPYCEFEMTW